jgi:site-specific recombinase XerD
MECFALEWHLTSGVTQFDPDSDKGQGRHLKLMDIQDNSPYNVFISLISAAQSAFVLPLGKASTARQVEVAFLLSCSSAATRRAYTSDLAEWFVACIEMGVDPLRASRVHVDAWARKLAEVDGRTPTTVARKLSAVSGFYRYAVNEDVIGRNPVAAVRRPKVGTDSQSTGLDRDELASLIAAARQDSPRTHALVLLLSLNGLRIAEALGADASDLDTERGHRVLRITRKGGKRATVPLAPRTADALDTYLNERSSGPLFATATGGRLDSPAVWRTLRRLATVAVPAKSTSLHPHDLRHAFVTLSLDAGASLRDVQDAAGHADPRTTRRYDRARNNLDRHPTYALAGIIG